MKKLFLLLAAVGLMFTACTEGDGFEENNDTPTEQPDDGNGDSNDDGNNGDPTEQPDNTPTDPDTPDTPDTPNIPNNPDPIFEITPTNCKVAAEGGTITLTLRHDVDEEYLEYAIYDEQYNEIDWIELVGVRTNTITLEFKVSANTSSKSRKAIIGVFDAKNNKEQETIITQESASEAKLVVTPITTTISADGGIIEFTLVHDVSKSNLTYSIDTDAQSWLSLSGTRSTTSYYTFKAAANTSTSSRVGTITFKDNVNSIQQVVTITQKEATPQNGNDENKKIYYTTYAGTKVEPTNADAFGSAKITSNTCNANGNGVITFDREVTTIGDRAFFQSAILLEITLPESVTSIGNSSFEGCVLMQKCLLPKSVETIGSRAFYNCSQIQSISIGNRVTTIGDEAFYNAANASSLIIGSSVTSIGNNAFYYCKKLTTVTIPNSVQTIGNGVFEDCDAITTITLGSGVKSIGEKAFKSCRSLQSIKIPDAITTIKKETFCFCESLSSVILPTQLLTIENEAFSYCDNLDKIVIPGKTKTIGESFYYSKIKYLEIPKSVTSIAQDCFDNCHINKLFINTNTPNYNNTQSPFTSAILTEIIIGDDVTYIGTWTFHSGSIVTVGRNVTTLGELSLGGVLEKLYCKPTTPPTTNPLGRMAYSNVTQNFKIYVPRSAVEAYKNDSHWGIVPSYIIGYDF